MHLGVGKRERAPPRAAENNPFFDVEMVAQGLHVGDQMRCRVIGQISVRTRTSRATLIKYNDAIMCRIEKSPMRRTRARARSAMQENDRFSVWIAGFFPIHLMALIQPEMIAAQWRNVGIEIGA